VPRRSDVNIDVPVASPAGGLTVPDVTGDTRGGIRAGDVVPEEVRGRAELVSTAPTALPPPARREPRTPA
jgi:hypothetical protein